MKISRYVFLFGHKDKYFIYNSLSNSLIEIDDEAYIFLKKLQDTKEETDLTDLDETARDLLVQNRIVTENDEDDFLMYKASITRLRAQRESMHLTLAPTMQCCFNCPYCFEKGKGGEAMQSPVMDAIVKFVISHKELQELNLTWFGGEPLMAISEIEEFYDKLMEQLPENVKFGSNIITSGYHLDARAVEILKKVRVSSMQITLDGLRETHNKIKNFPGCGDVFEKVIGNIEQANALAPDIHTVIRVNLTMDNAHEYPELYRFLADKFKGKKNISIAPAFVLDRSATPSERCNSALFSHSGRSEYILKLASLNLDSPFLRYPRPFFTECAIRNANAVSFDPEGYAYKCWESIGNRDYAVWKLNEEGIPVDVNIKLLNRHMYGADPLDDPACSKCKYLPVCGGGCPLQRIENRFEGKHNPLCTFYKGYLPEFMKIHIDRKEAGTENY